MTESSITPHSLVDILRKSNVEAESILFNRMRQLDRTEKLSYAEKGFILQAVEQFMLHESRVDDSGKPMTFTRWVREASPWSYSTSFQAKRDMEQLADVPEEQLALMPAGNIRTLLRLSTKVRSEPSVLEAAKTQRPEEFVESVRTSHPDQHLSASTVMRFKVDDEAVSLVEEAIDYAISHSIAGNWGEALERMAVTALEQWKLEEEIRTLPVDPCEVEEAELDSFMDAADPIPQERMSR